MKQSRADKAIAAMGDGDLWFSASGWRHGSACLYTSAAWSESEMLSLVQAIDVLFPGRRFWPGVSPLNLGSAIVAFNDHEDTTWEDVVMVLKHATEGESG